MHWIIFIYSAFLFFILTPGVLLTLPPKGKKNTVAMVHAILFGLVWAFTHKLVLNISRTIQY